MKIVLALLLLLLNRFSRIRLWDPIDGSPPGSPSLGFSRQEHWCGLPFPSPMHESEKWKWSRSVVSDSQRLHGLQPTRLLCPWDFPGKSTGVGCHCLLRVCVINIPNYYYANNWFCYKCLLSPIPNLPFRVASISEYNKDFSITVRFQENKVGVAFVYHPQWVVV